MFAELDKADIVSDKSSDDPLLECLLIITKLEHNPRTADELISGLPLVNNVLTPELFSRAAKRAGIQSKIVKRSLERIPQLVLPAVLVLKDNQACVLEHMDMKNNQAKIIQPTNTGGHSSLIVSF